MPGMNVEMAEERIIVLPDPTTMEAAEQRAWARRIEAFGAIARMSGLLSKPKDDIELTYKEKRLQPFWRLAATAIYAYERTKTYAVKVAGEVQSVAIAGETKAISHGEFTLSGLESCREETRKEFLYDGLASGAPDTALSGYLKYDGELATDEELHEIAKGGTIVVPPQAKASMIVREVVAAMLSKIDADKVMEETVRIERVDLIYRPLYAFRYRRAGKEAVLELDPLTGAIKPGGATFETYLGKILEPSFLFDVTVETANIFFPGATLARVIVNKSLEFKRPR